MNAYDFVYQDHRGKYPKGWTLAILVDGKGAKSRWNFYILDSKFSDCVSVYTGRMNVGLKLYNGQGVKVAEDEFNPMFFLDKYSLKLHIPWTGQVSAHSYRKTSLINGADRYDKFTDDDLSQRVIEIYPMATIEEFTSAAKTYRQRVSLTLEELKSIKDMKCEVSFTPAKAK